MSRFPDCGSQGTCMHWPRSWVHSRQHGGQYTYLTAVSVSEGYLIQVMVWDSARHGNCPNKKL